MHEQTQEQEDEVNNVQVERVGDGTAGLYDAHEVLDDPGETCDNDDEPQDLAVFDAVSRSLDLVDSVDVVLQQSGIDGDGVLFIGMHRIVDERHHEEDEAAHDEVHRVENGLVHASLIGFFTDGVAAGNGERDGSGQTGVPDNEAGVGGCDQQSVVDVTDTLSHFLGQQGACDQTEAPVQPAADNGDEGREHDSASLVLGDRSDAGQESLEDRSGSHSGTEYQDQSHLHGEGEETPEAACVTPGLDHGYGTLTSAEHCEYEYHDAQDDSEQERIRQPSVDYVNATIGKFLEHKSS